MADPPLSRGEERSLKTVVDQSWIRHPRHLPPQTNALYFPSISQHLVRLHSVIGDMYTCWRNNPPSMAPSKTHNKEDDLELKYVHFCIPEPVVMAG